MIINVYGKTDLNNLRKILSNSGIDVNVISCKKTGPYQEIYIVEIMEKEHV